MHWRKVKASLLASGSARLSGEPAPEYISRSAAGPGAGGEGSVFITVGKHRVRLSLDNAGEIEVVHRGGGVADVFFGTSRIPCRLEQPGLHCPGQAYITITGTCIFHCRYCNVPHIRGQRKTIPDIIDLVDSVKDRIAGISLTSGVQTTVEEEEKYVIDVVTALLPFNLPIGVSIYPTAQTPEMFHDHGVAEVKFNIEAATPAIFSEVCPDLDYDMIWDVLESSVALFGKNRVFSNVIIGLGETDAEMERCIRRLTRSGVIPVLRPLNPTEGFGHDRPPASRLLHLLDVHEQAIVDAGLDTGVARTMCTNCTGCDLVPGRDT